jgi:hypothetical protein
MIAALDVSDATLIATMLVELKEKLDVRFFVSEREIEFLRYCQKLISNQEYLEFRRILAGKINKNENQLGNKAPILDLSLYRKLT